MLLHFFVHRRKSCTFVPSKIRRNMDRIRLKDKEFELFIPEEEIKEAIAKVAERIRADVEGTHPLFVGILNGAFMFTAELMRQLNEPYEITFARYSSYKGTSTTGVVREIMPVQADVKGRTLILIEDIIDTGFTMQYVMDKLRKDGAADVKLATMLFKPDSLKCDLKPDYIGIRIPSDFIVGYGLDYDELSLPERWECTCRIYRSLGYKPVNLSACCEREGIELKHHEALSDARGCAKLYLNFLEKYRPLSTLW